MTPDKVEAALAVLRSVANARKWWLTPWSDGGGNDSPKSALSNFTEASKGIEEAISVLTEALADYRELQLAVWKARAILGFDNDGDETPDALTYPSLAELVVRDAQEFRNDYDATAKG